jgi:hypothetical protein
MSGLSAIFNAGQELLDPVDVVFAPGMHFHVAKPDSFWSRHLVGGNISTESTRIDTKFLRSLSCGKDTHSTTSVVDISEEVKRAPK